MGFNKRYISKENLKNRIQSEKDLKSIFNSECIVFTDKFSEKIFELYQKGESILDIKTKISRLE